MLNSGQTPKSQSWMMMTNLSCCCLAHDPDDSSQSRLMRMMKPTRTPKGCAMQRLTVQGPVLLPLPVMSASHGRARQRPRRP